MQSNLVGATRQVAAHSLTTLWSLHLSTCAVQACPVTACKRVRRHCGRDSLQTQAPHRSAATTGTRPQGDRRSGCEAGEKKGRTKEAADGRQGVSMHNCSTWAKHMRHAACFTHPPREIHVGVWIPGQAGPVPALVGHASGWVRVAGASAHEASRSWQGLEAFVTT